MLQEHIRNCLFVSRSLVLGALGPEPLCHRMFSFQFPLIELLHCFVELAQLAVMTQLFSRRKLRNYESVTFRLVHIIPFRTPQKIASLAKISEPVVHDFSNVNALPVSMYISMTRHVSRGIIHKSITA